MSNVVKWLTSDMQGAPQLTNDWGVLIGMLDACLINGFNTQNPSSVTRSGSTVTLTFSGGGHGFLQHQVILVSGAAQSEYNGEQRVTAVTGTTVTFTIAGTPTSPATGTIAVKTAALGFEKPFSGTNKAVYRSPNVTSSRLFLRVDNSLDPVWNAAYAKFGKVTISDGMSDVDTFTGSQAPYEPTNPTRNHIGTGSGASTFNGWARWHYAHANNSADTTSPTNGSRNWLLVGDDAGFYFMPAWQPSETRRALYCFNDIGSYKSGDAYKTVFFSTLNYATANTSIIANTFSDMLSSATSFGLMLKSHTQTGSPVSVGLRTLALNGGIQQSGVTTNNVASPNPADNAYVFHPAYVREVAGNGVLRGEMQGLYWVLQATPFADMTFITDVIDSDRIYLGVQYGFGASESGRVLFDITGSWR